MTLADNSSAGGVSALCFGAFVTVLGGVLVTDFRGFSRWFTRGAEASGSGLRRIPPWRWLGERSGRVGVIWVRLIGGVFAVVGLVVLVVGVVLTARGQGRLLARAPHPPVGEAKFIYPVMAGLWLIQFWRPGGRFAAVWRKGGAARRVLMVLASAAVVGFVVAWWQGFSTLAVVAFFAAWLGVLVLASPLSRRLGTPDTDPGRAPVADSDG
ncbi:hypothetical protein [Kitasatospora sp. NBC_01300]|uniref:hypothetical protein n=1 Tax=Kitasatospora sp. NBC_01300 TaxID=2903574 RepID=UPI00352C9703|nr:hypothetical protein OG556_36305 [Kitasatospora sp. NBC_01300]